MNYYAEPSFQILTQIVQNNIIVALINIIGGFSLGLISILNLYYNGVILGYSINMTLLHFPPIELIKHFLPHSIEIVGIIISGAVGVNIALLISSRLFQMKIKPFSISSSFQLTIISIIIILVSSLIEVYISMSL